MNYEYKMVQIPNIITLEKNRAQTGTEAAEFLENYANQMARAGWEFYRVDTISVQT